MPTTEYLNRLKWLTIRLTSCASLLLVVGNGNAVAQNPNALRSPSEFSTIQDTQARSRALFTEAAKVIMGSRF